MTLLRRSRIDRRRAAHAQNILQHFRAGQKLRLAKVLEDILGVRGTTPRCSPAVSDDPWCDADAHDARRPAEYSDGEGEARSSTAGAEWEDDRVRRGGEL